ncbi:hypothetical protein R1sor_019504 [Riccia sorocarpa]|uniref:CCT domain-containing protein n=1 Tax=Riccia sorocarpa TaxID=122646 RepID=A0ABD3IFE4_9MARC
MSGENDDLFSPPGGLLFGDITGNGDDLDFTKDFFSDDISTSTVLNGSTYEDMGGDDLIADLSNQDDFPRLGGSELSDSSSFGVNVEPKATTTPSGHSHSHSHSQQQQTSHTKPFANGQVLPAYGNFQKPSINLAHMNSGGYGVPDMYMSNNAMRVIPSPTSPATPMKSSSGLLSPGATSERLNCLSLDQMGYNSYRPPFDGNKGVVPRGYGMNGGRMNLPPGSPAGDKRFCSSPLSSPTVQASSNSSGISPFGGTGTGGQEITSGEIMRSPSSQSLHSSEAASPRAVVVSSGMESKDGVVVADGSYKMQASKPMFMSASGLAHRLGPGPSVDNSGFVPQVDSNGDGLRPLPSAISARPPIMQRSYSSHALGQLRTLAPPHQSGDPSPVTFAQRMAPLETPSRLSNGSSSPHLQPQLSELQNIHMRPLMQSMRRVHSTGDIQTLNGMAGGASSPSSLDRSYEEGGMKIGRYTMEERKIRIHRYQQKRTQRNFNKKIKYACRKTLADSRPRVRGRFAKNDEVGESLMKTKNEDEDEEEEDLMFDEENSYIEDEPLGDISDLIGPNGVKLEHPPSKGVKLEQPHPERNQLLQT